MVGLKSIMSSSIVFNLFWNQSLLESCLVQSSYGSCNLPPTCTDSVIDLACNIACSLLVHVHLTFQQPRPPSLPHPSIMPTPLLQTSAFSCAHALNHGILMPWGPWPSHPFIHSSTRQPSLTLLFVALFKPTFPGGSAWLEPTHFHQSNGVSHVNWWEDNNDVVEPYGHSMSCLIQLCNHSSHIIALTMSLGLGRLS